MKTHMKLNGRRLDDVKAGDGARSGHVAFLGYRRSFHCTPSYHYWFKQADTPLDKIPKTPVLRALFDEFSR